MNIVSIPKGIHRKCVTPLMNTKVKNISAWQRDKLNIKMVKDNKNLRLRGALKDYDYRNMHLIGLRLLTLCGVDVTGSGI